jgi:hypothetical protein
MSGTTATLKLEADLGAGSPRSSAPTWTDITAYLMRVGSASRGRTYELAQMNTGAFDLLLDNSDRRFDASNAAGPYYPNLVPMRPMRLTAVISATTYHALRGYALEFPPVWELPSWAEVPVRGTDGLGTLALENNLVGSWSQENTGTRIGHVLDAIGQASADRVLDTGTDLVAAAAYVAANQQGALSHVQACEVTENGLFFYDAQARAIFKSRRSVITLQSASKVTFGDAGGAELDYEEAPGDYSDKLIYNEVTVTDSANNAVTISDATSQGAYWPRSLTRATLLPAGSTVTTDAAQFLLDYYKQPGFRFQSLTFMASLSDTLMVEALTREIGDKITVKLTPPGGGARIAQDCIVQSITHHDIECADPLVWYTTYELAPAPSSAAWILDSSALGSTTKLVY